MTSDTPQRQSEITTQKTLQTILGARPVHSYARRHLLDGGKNEVTILTRMLILRFVSVITRRTHVSINSGFESNGSELTCRQRQSHEWIC